MEHEQTAALIADYATGRLDADERGTIERHVASCAGCRELLAEARDLRRALQLERPEQLMAHVQSAHLTRFALDRSGLDPGLSSWIEEHLSSCDACREAVEILRSEPARGPWEWLSRTILQPVPALAYLVLLVAVIGLWSVPRSPLTSIAPSAPEIEALPPAVSVYPAERFRSGGATEVEPVSIPAPVERDLYLRIHTEIDDAVLKDPAASFRLEISDGGTVVVAGPIAPGGITELGVLQLKIRAGTLEQGRTYRLEIRLDDGEALFHRDLRLSSAASLPESDRP